MSALFSMMRKEFIPASRSLMAMQMPEKPEPTMRTSTAISESFECRAEDSVMRRPLHSVLCWSSPVQHGKAEMQRLPAAIDGLLESGAKRFARRAARPARFSVRRRPQRRRRVQRDARSHRAGLRPRQREGEAEEVRRDRPNAEKRADYAGRSRRDSSAPRGRCRSHRTWRTAGRWYERNRRWRQGPSRGRKARRLREAELRRHEARP